VKRKMVITPKKCTGCTTCALTCSILYSDTFDLSNSHIRITKSDFNGTFEITLKTTCLSCCKCAEACPAGCLERVNVADSNVKEGS